MKILTPLIILGLASVALSAKEFTIQILAANKESTVKETVEKVKANGLVPEIFLGRYSNYVVTIGTYPTKETAKKTLPYVYKCLGKDAYIRLIDRNRIRHVLLINEKKVEASYALIIPTVTTVKTVENTGLAGTPCCSVYNYDCNTSESGVVIPDTDIAKDIIVHYNCNKLHK